MSSAAHQNKCTASQKEQSCFHGGSSINTIGSDFDKIAENKDIISADTLDAWFSPAPGVIEVLRQYLPWIIRTSPPIDCMGLIKTISKVRNIDQQCILPGAGSSDLIYLAFREWLDSSSRALVLNPTFGEYEHVLEKVIGCKVDRLSLSRKDDYALDTEHLASYFKNNYDLIVLVNPNSPTGYYTPKDELITLLNKLPTKTYAWIDEAYIEYTGLDHSLELFATTRDNVIVCKSMSKVYALSGVRAAYLCAAPYILDGLRKVTPPWSVSLPAQLAAAKSLLYPEYYNECYQQTRVLRVKLAESLMAKNRLQIIPGSANFILCHIPADGPSATSVVENCKKLGLYVRDPSSMGSALGHRALRITVQNADTNQRIVEILTKVLN